MSAQKFRTENGRRSSRPSGLVLASFVVAGLSAVLLPILLGPAAIILAAIAMSRKEPKAGQALAFAVVAILVGFALGAVLLV